MADNVQPVRPIDAAEREHRSPPPLILVAALLFVGGLIGWGAASLGGDSIATAPATTSPDPEASPLGDASLEAAARPNVDWIAAESVPPIPDGFDYAGMTGVAEIGRSIYLVMRFADSTTGGMRNELWVTADGVSWETTVLEMDPDVSIVDVTAIGPELLLTGVGSGTMALWRSIPDRTIDGSSWNLVDLEVPLGFVPTSYNTVVNEEGEVVTTVIGNLDVWRQVIAPYVPDGVNVSGEDSYLFDGSLFPSGGLDPITIFAESPEVLTTADSIWIRLISLDGEEILQTMDVPGAAYPVDSEPDLALIPLAMSWISDDGVDFLPVSGRNALPTGYYLPEPWQDGFVGAVYQLPDDFALNEQTKLWRTGSGRAWQPAEIQPPHECSPSFFATSRDRMLLSSQDGTQCVLDADGDWTVTTEPNTVSYVVGGPAGFLGYPLSFVYDTASFSRDGANWVEIDILADEPYPTLSILSDRLVAVSVTCCQPTPAKHVDIWVGGIS